MWVPLITLELLHLQCFGQTFKNVDCVRRTKLYCPELQKCYFLYIHKQICSKVPILLYFVGPKRPSGNCYCSLLTPFILSTILHPSLYFCLLRTKLKTMHDRIHIQPSHICSIFKVIHPKSYQQLKEAAKHSNFWQISLYVKWNLKS